jgi:hypothetical protein
MNQALLLPAEDCFLVQSLTDREQVDDELSSQKYVGLRVQDSRSALLKSAYVFPAENDFVGFDVCAVSAALRDAV